MLRSPQPFSAWPHRTAVLLVCATFPLIWVGGLVTTTDAGMAVRDWPTTNGYNMFFLPLAQWLGSGWKLFIEHSHRLMGALTGVLTLLFAAAVWLRDGRRWMRYVALLAVAGVIFQGVLGGFRVIEDERLLAMAHGCTGPAFFALAVVSAVFTSRRWREAGQGGASADTPVTGSLVRLAAFTLLLVYAQLVLGAQIRHMPPTGTTAWFDAAVFFHIVNAGLVLGHGGWLAWRCRKSARWVAVPAMLLGVQLTVQVTLGGATWIVNYGWPEWTQSLGWGQHYIVQAQSVWQSVVTTAHVALGSLILASGALILARCGRLASESRCAKSNVTSSADAGRSETVVSSVTRSSLRLAAEAHA